MKITIGHLYPDLLNLYGDIGNVRCLVKRCEWRGIDVELKNFERDDVINFSTLDIVLLGGGSDQSQQLVCRQLQQIGDSFQKYVEDGGVVVAICGGYQLLGHYYQTSQEKMEGLHILDIYTLQEERRLIGDIILQSDLADMPVVGFENHGGRTCINDHIPFGKVIYGRGNDGKSGYEGVVYENAREYEVPHVNRVLYDITSKSPATVEFE